MKDLRRTLNKQFLEDRHALMAYIRTVLGGTDGAEDVFQEVWLAFDGAIEKGKSMPNSAAWCRRVAKNIVLNRWRSQANSKVVYDSELINLFDLAFEENHDATTWRDREEALKVCIGRLPQKSSELLRLRHEEQMSIAQLSEVLKKGTSAVKVMLFRTRETLKQCVDKRMESCSL
ncbi:MAG: RNA polymerase sigma factor [Opitutales bacterium]